MEKRKKIFIVVGPLASVAIGYFLYQHFTYVTTDNAQIEAHSLMLAAKVGGFIKEAKVQEGDKVKANDLLIEIDGRDYETALKQAKSELTSIEAKEKDAERNFHRISELFAREAVSRQQYDTASANFSEIKAKYDSISAQLSQAEFNLENTKIRAPANGFIAKRSAESGQLANPGTPLIGFVSAEERWVIANFKETDIESIKVGAPVIIEVDALSGHGYKGHVESISSATGATFTLLPPDNATGNFTKVVQRVPVKIKIEDLDAQEIEKLRAGLSAYVKVSRH